ncbi:MAG: PepSY domain-containing protein [Pseudomonadota bacterium]
MTVSSPAARSAEPLRGGAFYRLVWKWHFLASLYVLPFMLMLAVTGGIYLYKPQIEEALYAHKLNVEATGPALPFETQVAAVEEAHGMSRLRGISTEQDPTRSTVIEFDDADKTRTIAWVDPYSGEVLGAIPRDDMAMRVVRKIHGELLLGETGTKFVELAAHWAIVMFITGAVLWWPRGERTLAKAVSLPTGSPKKRSWWRETHLFTGMLATILVVPIIISGLPWTDVWGGGLSYVQEQTGTKSKSYRFGGGAPKSSEAEGETIAYAEVFAIAEAEGLKAPYEMRPPRKPEDAFWIRSDSVNRGDQSELVIDRYNGEVLARIDFADNPGVAKAVSWGISFHQGELYGVINLIQNTVAAILAAALAVSGFVAWWMRRPKGTLGVPAAPEARVGTGMIFLTLTLMILFPLMGASLLLALILDWLIFRHFGWFRARPAGVTPAE